MATMPMIKIVKNLESVYKLKCLYTVGLYIYIYIYVYRHVGFRCILLSCIYIVSLFPFGLFRLTERRLSAWCVVVKGHFTNYIVSN